MLDLQYILRNGGHTSVDNIHEQGVNGMLALNISPLNILRVKHTLQTKEGIVNKTWSYVKTW